VEKTYFEMKHCTCISFCRWQATNSTTIYSCVRTFPRW